MKTFQTLFLLAFGGMIWSAAIVADPVTDGPDKADSITLGVGPGLTVLPTGQYQFVTVYLDGRPPTTVNQIVGGGDNPVPPPPPPTDVRAAVKAALAGVNDPNKAKTAEALVAAYGQLIDSANKGDIKDSASLAGAVKVFTMTMTLANSAAWQPFATVVDDSLGRCAALPACVSVLEVIVEELEAIVAEMREIK